MDRNTLTALLLITVVLILTPYYMELISPPLNQHMKPAMTKTMAMMNQVRILHMGTTQTMK